MNIKKIDYAYAPENLACHYHIDHSCQILYTHCSFKVRSILWRNAINVRFHQTVYRL